MTSNGKTIRATVTEYNGQQRLDIREWFTSKKDGQMYPTKKGVQIDPTDAPSLIRDILVATGAAN